MADSAASSAPAAPAFSLSQYEETKQRLRLLAEAQRNKRAAAAAAAATANQPASAASAANPSSAATAGSGSNSAAISESKESGVASAAGKSARTASAAAASVRPFTASTLKAAPAPSSTRDRSAPTAHANATPAASPSSVAPVARPLVRASSARGATPQSAAAAGASAAASPHAAVAAAPIQSSYHPSSSPRAAAAAAAGLGSSGGASGGWTSSRGLSAASVQAQAQALNAAIPSPSGARRPASLVLDSTGGAGAGTGEMTGTTFFPVSTAAGDGAGSAGSTLVSPRAAQLQPGIVLSPRSQGASTTSAAAAAAADGSHFRPLSIHPSALPAPPPSSASLLSVYDDHGVFASKLDALLGALRSTAESLGLKYSADSKLLAARNDVEALHALSVRRGNEALQALHSQWTAAHSQIDSLASSYTAALAAAKLEVSDRIRRLQKSNASSLARAQKDLELQLRAEYREREAKQSQVEKYNAEKLKSLEDQIRREVKAASALDNKKTRASEQALQEQLARLESQGMVLLQSKESELAASKDQIAALQSQLHASREREGKWERKALALTAEKREISETLSSERIQLAEMKQDHQALMHRLSREQEARASLEQEASQRASTMAEQVATQRLEIESLRAQISTLQSSLASSSNAHTLAIASLKSKHSTDLDAVSSRVQQLLARKDEQLREIKEKYRQEQEKSREMERFVQEQIG